MFEALREKPPLLNRCAVRDLEFSMDLWKALLQIILDIGQRCEPLSKTQRSTYQIPLIKNEERSLHATESVKLCFPQKAKSDEKY